MSHTNIPTPVLLLKTRSSPVDGYEEYFQKVGGYQPCFVPVLEHQFREDAFIRIHDMIKSERLVSPNKIASPGQYGGIIFTSQRAVEALSDVVRRLRQESFSFQNTLSNKIPFYVVGPATARGLRTLGLENPICGEESGNGEALASFILKDYNSLWKEVASPKPPLLFLVGEQRRDIIPKTLQSDALHQSQRIGVEELVVYETGEMQSFRADFTTQWSENVQRGCSTQWVVVFSPTGCKAMLESLNLLDSETGMVKTAKLDKCQNRILIATIGPTTRDYLRREFDFEPDVCAQVPSPEGVGDSIAALMAQISKSESQES
jgi:uroporphyrinogen-III synthase